jgi:hypothetical protein
MSVLRIDGAQLDAMSSRITAAVPKVRFGPELSRCDDGHVGSSRVAMASRDGSRQQHLRAGATAETLSAVGDSPRGAVATFAEADAAMARAF